VIVDSAHVHVIEHPHHLLGKPDILIGINRIDGASAAGSDKGQIFSRRGADDRDPPYLIFFSRSCLPPLVYQKASHEFGLERLLHPIAKDVVVILDIPLGKSFFIHSKDARVMEAFG